MLAIWTHDFEHRRQVLPVVAMPLWMSDHWLISTRRSSGQQKALILGDTVGLPEGSPVAATFLLRPVFPSFRAGLGAQKYPTPYSKQQGRRLLLIRSKTLIGDWFCNKNGDGQGIFAATSLQLAPPAAL